MRFAECLGLGYCVGLLLLVLVALFRSLTPTVVRTRDVSLSVSCRYVDELKSSMAEELQTRADLRQVFHSGALSLSLGVVVVVGVVSPLTHPSAVIASNVEQAGSIKPGWKRERVATLNARTADRRAAARERVETREKKMREVRRVVVVGFAAVAVWCSSLCILLCLLRLDLTGQDAARRLEVYEQRLSAWKPRAGLKLEIQQRRWAVLVALMSRSSLLCHK
jgi:hypothetical protein